MTALSVPSLTSAPAMLRPLSGFERLFRAIDEINGFNFGIAVSFRGLIAHARWMAAFERVRRRHPLLNAGINDDDPQAPFFSSGAGLPIPIAFQRRISSTDWQRVMESDIAEPFDLLNGPLLRVAVLEDDRGCDLVITANHVVLDGMGMIALVRDLLRALNGETLTQLPIPLSAEDRAAEVRSMNPLAPAPQNPVEEPQPRNRSYGSRNRKGKAAISAIRFSQEETEQLLRYARREQTTVGAVLSATATSALRDLSPQLEEADLRLTAALDARPFLGNPDDFVLSIISPRAIVPCSNQGLGASARAIKAQIAPAQSYAAIEATYERVSFVLGQKLDATTLVNMLAQSFGHDLGMSNLRTVDFPSMSDGPAIESVWGPSVLVGYEGEHFIGSATFNGALHLTYSSFTPMTGLLETVRETIAKACADA